MKRNTSFLNSCFPSGIAPKGGKGGGCPKAPFPPPSPINPKPKPQTPSVSLSCQAQMQPLWHHSWFWRKIESSHWKCTQENFITSALSWKGTHVPWWRFLLVLLWLVLLCKKLERRCVLPATLTCASPIWIISKYHANVFWERTPDKLNCFQCF